MNHTTLERRPRRQRRRSRLISLAVALPLLLPATAPAAQAAGLDGMISFGNYEIGAFVLADGSLAYCLEPGAEAPLSAQHGPTRVSELPGYAVRVNDAWGWSGEVRTSPASGEKLRQINWLLAEHGDTRDPDKAAVVQIALWEIRREPGNAAWIDGKYAHFSRNGGEAHVAAGRQLAQDAKASARGPGEAVPDGTLELGPGEAWGTGTVSYPRGTTELSIVGGLFSDGSSTMQIPGGTSGTVEWAATPHEPEWRRFSEVTISGDWSVSERFWPAEIILYPSVRAAEQRLGAGVGPTTGQNPGSFTPVRAKFDSRFTPAITTQVPAEIVQRTDAVFRDTVTVTAEEQDWPSKQNGAEFLPLRADGALYGPFLTPQDEQPEPPDGAPVAARGTLDITEGPGTYDVELAPETLAAGYYYWLWEIWEERQSEEVRASQILAPGSHYADQFGVRAERQLVPTALRWETRLEQREVTSTSRVLDDRIRATLVGGGWLRNDEGARTPANVRLTFYQADEQPRRQPMPPEGARELGSVNVSLSEPDAWIAAPSFEVAVGERGWITVQACLFAEDQDADAVGIIEEWCDDYGVPDETAKIVVDLAETGGTAPSGSSQAESLPVTPFIALAAGLLSLGGATVGIAALRSRSNLGRAAS